MSIVFAGLGVMGGPMAGHLVSAGHNIWGYNRSPDKAKAWALEHKAEWSDNFETALKTAKIFILCVGRDQDVDDLVRRAVEVMPAGGLIIDHTTTSAKLSRNLGVVCQDKGIDFCDAPVSGGQAGAINGQLSIMAGCAVEVFDQVVAITAPYTKSITRIGEIGSGQTAKMCNQIAISGLVQGLAEALHFAKCANLDTDLVFQAISAGAAGSWQMQNRWKTMSEGQYGFGFMVDWMRKDLGIALEEARVNGAHLAVTALVDQFYSEVQAMGGQRFDTSSLHLRLEARRKT
jgi:3-hydroxyisobutyrate dehydrogenase-like beta-hydroxyacid dehydrogenase